MRGSCSVRAVFWVAEFRETISGNSELSIAPIKRVKFGVAIFEERDAVFGYVRLIGMRDVESLYRS
jgi:hypothetical protein